MCKAIFSRSNQKFFTQLNFFAQPAAVMVVTNIKYVCNTHNAWWGKYAYVNNKHLYMIQSSEAHCRHQMNDYGKFCAAHEFESKSRWMAVLWSHQSDTWFTYQWPGVPNWWTQHPHQHCCGMQIEVTTTMSTTQHSDSGCHIYGGLPTYTWSHHSLGSLVWML